MQCQVGEGIGPATCGKKQGIHGGLEENHLILSYGTMLERIPASLVCHEKKSILNSEL